MKMDVVKNAKRNMFFGIINKVVCVVCPFITRTVLQYTLGEEYLGLSSLFTSILSVLSLTELGFGTAIVYSMYKPVAEGNDSLVNALLNFYRKAYLIIGCIILVVGICLIPFLPHLITGSYPSDCNLVLLYLIYLCNTVVSYFMYAYMSSLLVVYQRDDVNSSTNMLVTLVMNVIQVVLLVKFRNYFVYSVVVPVFTVVNNLRIAFVVKRMFPQYHCEGHVSTEILKDMKKQIGGTFVSRVCQVTRNSFDSICISAFIGLSMTAMYNNYYYVITAAGSFLGIFSSAITGGIGNHVVTRSVDENYQELRKLDFVYMWIGGCCTVCILCLSQPFMRLWMGESMMLNNSVIYLLCIYFYLLRVGDMRSVYVSACGLWWQNRWRSIAEAVSNIILNIVLAKFFGIYGIITATILTIFTVHTIWGSRVVFRNYFGLDKMRDYFAYHIKYAGVTLGLCVLLWLICQNVNIGSIWITLLVRLTLCVVLSNLVYYVIYHGTTEFHAMKNILSRH